VSAREEVLARIATAHRAAPPPDLPYDAIVRAYRTESDRDPQELTERLVDRLIDYRAKVRHCPADDLAGTIASALSERGARTAVVPAGLDRSWLGQVEAAAIRTDGTSTEDQLSVADLDATDGVITTCAAAIAETGTLILDGSADQGRRVITLIPDYHLCVVLPQQIVADVPQALARLTSTRPLTMISGPSATSDIELNRVEGVHGPRTLEVIIVGPSMGASPGVSTGSEQDDRGERA
jgi:L-lactate dehydrogenase complex protein LldG